MSSGEADFIAACVAAPADNGPRLIYGDWLQSKGDPRGELMVVQCRLAEIADDDESKEAKSLRATEKKLVKDLKSKLGAELAASIGDKDDFLRVEITRGFVSSVEGPADLLMKLGPLFEAAPLATELRLGRVLADESITTLDSTYFASPHLERVEHLVFGGIGEADELMKLVAACKHLRNLRAFEYLGTKYLAEFGRTHLLTEHGTSLLAASPHLTKLTRVGFESHLLGDAGVKNLIDAPWKLESLNVSDTDAGTAVLEVLARAKHQKYLRRLELRDLTTARPDDVRALVSAKHLASLENLDLENANLDLGGLEALLDAIALPRLEELVLARNGFGEKGAKLLAKSRALAQLKRLDITKNGFNKIGVVALAAGPGLEGIGKVLLDERDSTDARKALAESKLLAKSIVYFRGKRIAKPK